MSDSDEESIPTASLDDSGESSAMRAGARKRAADDEDIPTASLDDSEEDLDELEDDFDFRPARASPGILRAISSNRVLIAMLAASVLLHAGILGLFWGMRLISGASAKKANLVSREFLIDLGSPLESAPPPVQLPQLKPPPGPALPQLDPPVGTPINILTVKTPAARPGLPSGGQDLQSRMLGFGGIRDGPGGGLLGGGAGAKSFSLGGGTVRASAIVVLLDASGSMQADQKMDRAREKMRDLTRRAGVRVVAEIEVPNCAFVQIAEPGADPGSPVDAAYAMSAAMRKFPFADAIYFFSDFQDTVVPGVVDQLRLIAMEYEPKVGIYLHTLEQKPDGALAALCRATGGQILK